MRTEFIRNAVYQISGSVIFKAVLPYNKEVLDIRTPVYENVRDYPENNAFGDVPAYGFYIRHADRVTLEDWEVIPRTMNTREALVREYTD